MNRRLPLFLVFLVSMVAARAQILLRVQQGNNISPVGNGGTVGVNAKAVGQSETLSLTIIYTGAGQLTFPQAPEMLGSQDFSITSPSIAGAALGPYQNLSIGLRYLPSSSQLALAELDLRFTENTTSGTTTTSTPGLIVVDFAGTAPEYALSYALPIDNNYVPVASGGGITVPDTVLNSVTTVTLVFTNRGSGQGNIETMATTGGAFSLASTPLLPVQLAASSGVQFQLRYRPTQTSGDSGTLTVTLGGGQSYLVQLTGRGIASLLGYEMLAPGAPTQALTPGQPIQLPATAVGTTDSVFIRMHNPNSADVTLNTIAVSGSSFQVSNTPFLPLVMHPGDVETFTLDFTPTKPGPLSGRLLVGSDTFDLEGNGLGLRYTYSGPAGTGTIGPQGTLVFPNVAVGQSASLDFTIQNVGTESASIVSLGIASGSPAAFALVHPPALPATLPGSGSLKFTVRFAPLTTGFATASLRINTDSVSLTGNGDAAVPLPDYTLQGPATVQPLDQPAVGLTLASPYPLNLVGTLTITTDASVTDPAVQFASGGRVANFTIPAGTTQAIFANGTPSLRFQAGTTAGTITLTPAFATESSLTLVPATLRTLQATMAASAPQVSAATLVSRTTTGFTLQALAITNTRTLTKADVTFKARAGFSLAQNAFSFDLSEPAASWFSSQLSASFGGQFVVQLPFTLTTGNTSEDATAAIESVTMTLNNEKGASSSVTVAVP